MYNNILTVDTRRTLKTFFAEVKFIIDAEQIKEIEIEHDRKVLIYSIKTENNMKSIVAIKKENEFLDLESFTNDIKSISNKTIKNKKRKSHKVETQNDLEDKKSTDISSFQQSETQSKSEDNQIEDEINEFIKRLNTQSVHKQYTLKISLY